MDVTYQLIPSPSDKSKDWGWNEAIASLLEYEHNICDNSYDSDELELELWAGNYGYIRTGLSLRYIAYFNKYRDRGFRTFKQYCQRYAKITDGYAKKLIQAADVAINLIKAGYKQIPTCFSQAAPLIKFNTIDRGGNSPLGEQWDKVLDYAGAVNKGRVTATVVKDVLECNTGKSRISVGLNPEELELLEKKSAEAGLTKQEFLRQLLKGNVDDLSDREPEPPEDYEYPDPYTQTKYYEDTAKEIIEAPEAPKQKKVWAKDFLRLLVRLEVKFEGIEHAAKIMARDQTPKTQKIQAKNFINLIDCYEKKFGVSDSEEAIDNFQELPENRGIP